MSFAYSRTCLLFSLIATIMIVIASADSAVAQTPGGAVPLAAPQGSAVHQGNLQQFVDTHSLAFAAAEPDSLPSRKFPTVFVDARAEVSLPAVDVVRFLREDAGKASDVALRPRVGVRIAARLSAENSGRWVELGAEGRVWIASVRSAGATGIRLHFSDFELPAGATLSVHAASTVSASESYSGRGPYGDGDFWTSTLDGDTAIVEYYDPAATAGDDAPPLFTLDGAVHFYRDPMTLELAAVVKSAMSAADLPPAAAVGACQLDSTCYADWAAPADAVARIIMIEGESAFVCSGTLLSNNTSDLSPLFLTANHCVPNEAVARTVEANFFYHTLSCNGKPPTDEFTALHARYLAGSTPQDGTDYTLLELLGSLPRRAGAYPTWAGWTTEPQPLSSSMTGIHHPGGSYRRISFGASQLSATFSPRFPKYYVVGWYFGVVEPGSSGSAVFDPSGRVLGQLSAGNASCTLTTGIDIYGQLTLSYPTMVGPDGSNWLEAGLGDDALEPNDSRAAARELGSTARTRLVVKNYGSGLGEDWYRLGAAPNQLLEAEAIFRHSWGDINLELYRGTEATPVATARGVADRERLSFRNGAAAETYFLRVLLVGDTRNTYDLVLAGARVPCEDSFEPNDNSTAAVSLAAERGFEGRLCSETDVDWFRINVPSIAQVRVSLIVPAGKDYDMALYDTAGNLLGTSEKLRGEMELIVRQVGSPSSFLVKVYGFPANRGEFDTSNSYTFGYSLCEDLFEPNPNFDAAFGSISAGAEYVGRLCTATDLDWFKIEVPVAGQLTLNLAVPATQDYDLAVYSPARTLIRSSVLGVGRAESLTTTVVADTYYVRVIGFLGDFDTREPYVLSATYNGQQIPVQLETNPPGLRINVDGNSHLAPQTVNWTLGSRHVIGVDSPQVTADGTAFEFSAWSDSGSAYHLATAEAEGTITATMTPAK